MENAFQLQGWNTEAYEALSETLILHGTGGRLFCSLPAVKIHFISCSWHATRKSHQFQKGSKVKGSYFFLLNRSHVFQGQSCCQTVRSGATHLMSSRSEHHCVVSESKHFTLHLSTFRESMFTFIFTNFPFDIYLARAILSLFLM